MLLTFIGLVIFSVVFVFGVPNTNVIFCVVFVCSYLESKLDIYWMDVKWQKAELRRLQKERAHLAHERDVALLLEVLTLSIRCFSFLSMGRYRKYAI